MEKMLRDHLEAALAKPDTLCLERWREAGGGCKPWVTELKDIGPREVHTQPEIHAD